MKFVEILKYGVQKFTANMQCKSLMAEQVNLGRASALISHKRPYDFDEKTGLYLYKNVDDDELVWNVKTNGGIDFMKLFGTPRQM